MAVRKVGFGVRIAATDILMETLYILIIQKKNC